MTASNDNPQLQALLAALHKNIEERLARFDIELSKKIDERMMRIDAAVTALEAHVAYRNEAQSAAMKRREAAAVRKSAAVAAQEACPFDPKNVYATLVNPRGRVKDVLVEYTTEAANKYSELPTPEAVLELFTTDFKHWDESHFRSLPKKDTAKLREVLLEKQVSIRGGRFPAFRALSHIIRNNNRTVAAAATAAAAAAAATAATNTEVKSENVEVNGTNKVSAVSSPMSPPNKGQRTGNTNVAM